MPGQPAQRAAFGHSAHGPGALSLESTAPSRPSNPSRPPLTASPHIRKLIPSAILWGLSVGIAGVSRLGTRECSALFALWFALDYPSRGPAFSVCILVCTRAPHSINHRVWHT